MPGLQLNPRARASGYSPEALKAAVLRFETFALKSFRLEILLI